jgi:hypothetical protein
LLLIVKENYQTSRSFVVKKKKKLHEGRKFLWRNFWKF